MPDISRKELKKALSRETEVQRKWRQNIYEVALIGLILASVTSLAAIKVVTETSYMLIVTAICTYAFGRIFNHVQGKE